MMAAQFPVRGMQTEPCAAARAARSPAAGLAREDRRIAAAVDEHEALLTAREARPDGIQCGLREPVFRIFAAQVHSAYRWQARTGYGPVGQAEQLVAAGAAVEPRFQPRGRP